MNITSKKFISVMLFSIVIAACGGGGGSSGTTSTSLFSGVVASGAPVTNGAGYALNAATGLTTAFTTNASGNYSVNLTGQAGPFLLHVVGLTSAGSPVNMYSLAAASSFGGTINVTPLSNVVLAYAAGVTTQSLETTCTNNLSACPALLNGILASLSSANTAVVSAIPSSVLSQFGLTASTFNAITTQFATTHAGVDGLLDAITVVPAVATGPSSYQINLVGSTPTTLVTVPTTGTAGTQATAPTTGTTPTAAALAQASSLAVSLGEIQTFMTNFNNLFATALPTSSQLSPYIDANFLSWGFSKTTLIAAVVAGNAFSVGTKISGGGLAPYSAAPLGAATTPGVNVSYDVNNCVTSIWVYFGDAGIVQFNDAIPVANTPGVCSGGTWTLAGNMQAYDWELVGLYQKWTGGGTTTYSATFQIATNTKNTTGNPSAVAPYDSMTITGPGLATMGNPTATTGTVTVIAPPVPTFPAVLQDQNSINDPYYGTVANGTSLLRGCADILAGAYGYASYTAATPCFNDNAVGDYTVKFYNGTTLLETDMQRINVAVSAASVPTSWYPTITSVTPSMASNIPTGSTVTPVTLTWTLPAGAQANSQGTRLYENTGSLIFTQEDNISPTATSHTINVSGLTVAPTSGFIGVLAPIGGLKVGAGFSF
jgi:hypothetical protein